MARKPDRDDREKRQRLMLLLLGFACLIQLFVSLQRSRSLVAEWDASREDDARRFDHQVKDETKGAPTQ